MALVQRKVRMGSKNKVLIHVITVESQYLDGDSISLKIQLKVINMSGKGKSICLS